MVQDDTLLALPKCAVRRVAVGDRLGKCLLTEALGRGGSCAVFRALHQGLNIAVAVKVLQPEGGEFPRRAYEQLRSEARLLAQLNHPHIVRALDFEDDPALPYLVLEIVEGPSLSDVIMQSGRLSFERACQVIGDIVEALAALWVLGAVHRDVKPGNILLTRAGAARLADLGTAVLLPDPETTTVANVETLDEEVAGTAAYLAPEQFLAPATVDHRADVYALGATFYEAVTGRLPFEGRSRAELLMKHAREQPAPPHQLVPELGAKVSEIILTMMAKDPDDRYQSAPELREALDWLFEPDEVGPARGEQQSRAETQQGPATLAGGSHTPLVNDLPRRSFWKTLLPGLRPRPARNDAWLEVLKRTLKAPPRQKG